MNKILNFLLIWLCGATAQAQSISFFTYPFTLNPGIVVEDMNTGTVQLLWPGVSAVGANCLHVLLLLLKTNRRKCEIINVVDRVLKSNHFV